MDISEPQNNLKSQKETIENVVWRGYAMSEVARLKRIDPDNISIFDFPCFKEFTQEEEKITHRVYIFSHDDGTTHTTTTTLFDFSFWEGDDRPPIRRGIVPIEKAPFLEDDFSALFELDAIAPSNQTGRSKIDVRYSKEENMLEISMPKIEQTPDVYSTNDESEEGY